MTCTLRVSGDSLGVYMSSETQLERISIAAVDRYGARSSYCVEPLPFTQVDCKHYILLVLTRNGEVG